jgi:NodT family efflux transporter outer membrane factor (OMF) lipoprotein
MALALFSSGCALQAPPQGQLLRDQALPTLNVPAAWTAGGAAAEAVAPGWLFSFADVRLETLVIEALAHNADLRLAAARVEQAAAQVRLAGGQIYPAVDALARAGGKLSGDNSGLEGWLVSASWELDLWGRVRYQARASENQYAAMQGDFAYARQSLVALVVKSWFLASEARLQRDLAAEMTASAERTLALADSRRKVGAGSDLEVLQASANLQSFRDSARQLELGYQQALRALELLLGRYPAADIEVAAQLVSVPPPAPSGLPSALLERRPDVRAAERRIAAAFDLAQEAQAARLPRLALTAGASRISSELFVLQDRPNPVWSIGANLTAPLFHGGALKAQVQVRTAEQKAAVAAYAQVALQVFNEVENALASEFALRERVPILEQAVQDNQKALDLEEVRYRVGSSDLRAVTQQQLALYAARTTLLRVRSEQLVQRVNLHLALGGDFSRQDAPLGSAGTDHNASAAAARH